MHYLHAGLRKINMANDLKIIEITGMPCCGKTTIINEIKDDLDHSVIIYSDRLILSLVLKQYMPSSLIEIISKIFLLVYLLRHIMTYWAIIKNILPYIYRMKNSFYEKLYLFVNILVKLARYDFVKNKYKNKFKNKIVLFDEGLSHIVFNLIDYNNFNAINIDSILITMSDMLKYVNLIILDENRDVILSRLKNRGHKRIVTYSFNEINNFFECNKIIVESLITSSCKYFKSTHQLNGDSQNIKTVLNDIIMNREN